MNIYEIFVTFVEAIKGKTKPRLKRVSFPYLVAAKTGHAAAVKVRKVFEPIKKSRTSLKITYTRPDCIISNR